MSIISKILGDPNAREMTRHRAKAERINELRDEFKNLRDEELRDKTHEFKKQLSEGKSSDDILIPAFAAVREAMRRTLDKSHFDVQLIGGMVLHEGKISEMKTGEGKTFVAALAAYLNALDGKGVHIVTVNDYLARRDAGWLGPVYNMLKISVGVIIQDNSFIYDPDFRADETLDERLVHLRPVTRPEAYAADITYGTNNEFGFDYLRDNMVPELERCVQRKLNFAIVDEVDSILIDEARTPLIISGQASESTDEYIQFAQIVKRLSETEDYVVDEKLSTATITDDGIKKVEAALGVANLYIEGGVRSVHHLEQALRAHALFRLDKDYVVKDGEVIIVDEFTGRLMQGRRYSEGLHQAIEAKEGVNVKQESVTMATISFQNYFRMYKKLSGMTGTAATEAEEFAKIYKLDVSVVPTNREMVRQDLNDLVYKDEEAKFNAIADEIARRHEAGQPVLLGTISIEKNEVLSELLNRRGIKHEVLNAKNHEREAMIIAQTGRAGAVTIATNIAGRGVDIILGGEPYSEEAHQAVKAAGGLMVIGSERHESRRIDNQLRGRAGRQGDPGSSVFFVSLEDDLMRVFGGDRVKKMMETFRLPPDQAITNPIINKALESAQRRVEGHNFDIRKHLVEYDDVMNKHRQLIYTRRRAILEKADLKIETLEKIEAEISKIVDAHTAGSPDEWDHETIQKSVTGIMAFSDSSVSETKKLDREQIKDFYFDRISKVYEEREVQIGAESARQLERFLHLRTIDQLWIEHIDAMEHMRQGIGLRGYAQKDPLVEYKHESHKMFESLLSNIDADISFSIMKVSIGVEEQAPRSEEKKIVAGRGKVIGEMDTPNSQAQVREERESAPVLESVETGRNDPCPCGAVDPKTGKIYKYKKCGLINASYHKR